MLSGLITYLQYCIKFCKLSLGIISKKILVDILPVVRLKTGLLQWKNSFEVLKWFENISNKNLYTFMKFDVIEFYPSISKQL